MIGTMAHALSHVGVEQGKTLERYEFLLIMVVMSVSDLLLLKKHVTLKNAQVI